MKNSYKTILYTFFISPHGNLSQGFCITIIITESFDEVCSTTYKISRQRSIKGQSLSSSECQCLYYYVFKKYVRSDISWECKCLRKKERFLLYLRGTSQQSTVYAGILMLAMMWLLSISCSAQQKL